MISVIFSLDSQVEVLSEDEKSIIAKASISFVSLSVVGDRQMFEATIPNISTIINFQVLFVSRDPSIIGVWYDNGLPYGFKEVVSYDDEGNILSTIAEKIIDEELGDLSTLYPFNSSEYVSLLPSVKTYDENDVLISDVPRTIPVEIHKFGKRKDKRFDL